MARMRSRVRLMWMALEGVERRMQIAFRSERCGCARSVGRCVVCGPYRARATVCTTTGRVYYVCETTVIIMSDDYECPRRAALLGESSLTLSS